jgi:hypothetical protein
MRLNRSTVAGERVIPLRSTCFVVNKLTRADDDLIEE